MRRPVTLIALIILQAVCALFFVSDIVMTILGVYPVPIGWTLREALEIAAALGLILGLVFGAVALRRSLADLRRAEGKLRRASSAFMDVVDDRFAEWGLTPAERDVALFAIKGLSIQEIAALRKTSEGTVKAQTNAIYRKAGVTGRPQLLSLFIEELMEARPPADADPSSASGRAMPEAGAIPDQSRGSA
ncbi:MAG: hypothetical protein JJT81_11225 [Rubellimicrobium sp.]|nr:hypothetical protein [Rubellimicrobium sp.]